MQNKPPYRTLRQSWLLFWKNGINFTSRSSRSEYWWGQAFIVLISTLITVVNAVILAETMQPIITAVIGILFVIFILIPEYALTTRRFRDVGLSTGAIIVTYGVYVASFILKLPLGVIIINIFVFILELWPGTKKRTGRPYTKLKSKHS